MVYDSGYYEGVRYRVTCDEGLWYVQERPYSKAWSGVSPRVTYVTRDEAVTKMFELVKSRDDPRQPPDTDWSYPEYDIYEEDIRETWEYIEK